MAGWMRVAGVALDPDMGGVTAALVETDGVEFRTLAAPMHRAFDAPERAELARGGEASAEAVETAAAEVVARLPRAELLGFHASPPDWAARGQVIGSGQVLAEVTGLPVVWDFASADLQLGGLGTPLAAFFHHARMRGHAGPVAVLELGAWASLTWVDPAIPAPEHGTRAFVCGPGCATEGVGRADAAALERFVAHPFFRRIPPRDFADAPVVDVAGLSDADAAATRLAACAAGVVLGFDHFPRPPALLKVSACPPGLLAALRAGCGCAVIEEPPSHAEAIAYLAARVARGLPTTAPGTTGVPAPVGGGTLSQPGGAIRTPSRHKRID